MTRMINQGVLEKIMAIKSATEAVNIDLQSSFVHGICRRLNDYIDIDTACVPHGQTDRQRDSVS